MSAKKKKKNSLAELNARIDAIGDLANDSFPDSILKSTYKEQGLPEPTFEEPTIRSVESTVKALNSPKETKNTITDEYGNITVKSPIKTNEDGTVEVLRNVEKKKNPIEEGIEAIKYIGEKAGAGLLRGGTGLVDSTLQTARRETDKGSKQSLLENILELTTPAYGMAKRYVENVNNKINTLKSDDDILKKAINIGIQDAGYQGRLYNPLERGSEIYDLYGYLNPNATKEYEQIQKGIDSVSENVDKNLQKEALKQNDIVRTLGETADVMGNMAPSIATSMITKNPTLGIGTMGLQVKGQATKEAEQQGVSLPQAENIGYAKGGIEAGTELLSGGLKKLGGGVLDGKLNKILNKYVTNPVLNFGLKEGAGILGETGEEIISDLSNLAIDRATTDPNATYTLDDLKNTFVQTALSTGGLNLLTGGYGKKAYNLNKQEINLISNTPEVQETINNVVNTAKQLNPNITIEEEQNLIQETTKEIQKEVENDINATINQIQPQIPTQTPLNTLNQGVLQENVQTPYQTQTPQITPLNQVNQELQETRQQDVADSVKAMNLEQEPQFTQKQGNRNNEELDNSSFSLKQKQNDIIQKYNPKDEELGEHTWINSVDDIKTFKEALDYDDYENGNLTPDYTEEMINKALKDGTVTVYSSYPIEQGTFVTPSKMEAESYAGSDKVYSKEVPIQDVAWIDSLQGQYAKVDTRTNLQDINERNKPKQENKTTQEEKPQEMPKNEVKQEVKKSYLTNEEKEELEGLQTIKDSGWAELSTKEESRLEELEKKQQGITKKYPDLKTNNEFEDIKGIYGKYKYNEITDNERKVLNEAKGYIRANKQQRRTMNEWLQIAEYIGSNTDIKNSQDLQELAIKTWFSERPNTKDNLNRQGKKYVPFAVQDWVNAVYKGAGVGTDVKMSIEEATDNKGKKVDLKPTGNNTYEEVKKIPKIEKENIKYSIEEKIEKEVRNQYKSLSEDKIQKIIDLKIKQEQKNQLFSNFNNKTRAKQRKMINAYETNAEIRKIVQGDSLQKVEGGLTDTELAKAIKKENSNYIGKKVTVDGQNGTVVGNPYGRVKVEFEDGTTKTFDRDEVKSMNETKRDKIVEAKDNKGNRVDLKPSENNTYEQVNIKSKKNDVIPDMSNKVLNIGNEKVSNFYSNITEKSKFITEENRENLKDNANLKYYDAITNKDTLKNAMDKLNSDTEQQVGNFFAKKDFNAEDVATGWILVKRYQDAGNFEAMSNVIEKMREQGTKAGQTVQAYGILQRLTPEGMEYYSQKQLDKAFNEYSKNKSKKQIEKYAKDFTLTAEEHQFIKDTMEKVQTLEDEETKKVEIAKIVSMLGDKLPPEKGQRMKAWMRIAMLGNPKTQVRNVMGNAIIQPINWVGDVFSATADKIISQKTGIRTKGATDFGALIQGTKKGFKESVRDAKMGVDTRDINLDRFEENIGSKPFYEGHKSKLLNAGAKALNKTNKILGNVMSGGDRIFYQGIYENSLKNQMKLNKVNKPTQEMIDIATQEALQRTWNDSNEYTKAVLQIRNAMNKLNIKGYGLGDVLVPFAKTPANLTKAIVDYSPVGLTRTILKDGKNLKRSLQNGQYSPELQHKFADSLGKGFAGSLLYAAAYGLAKAGITSGASDDDKDVANFMRNTLGIQPYSVKIGDKSFTYDWAQPIAAPFAIMADAKRLSEKENQEIGDIIKTATSSASNILLEQSFLSSIQDVFNSYEGPSAAIKQQIQDLPARATPTFFKQIADLIDPTQRQTFVKGNEKETLKNKVQVKIPGASKELVSQRDTLGREIKKYGGDEDKLKYAFNVFLNPANTNKGKPSKAAEEIYAVYKATGDKTVMPRQVGYSENIGGTTKNLTAKERNELQKLSGQKVEENVKALIQNTKYNSMSNEDKAAVINGIVNYSFAKAKSDLFGTNISTMYKTAAKKEEQGIPLYDYYINRISKRK